MSINIQKTEHPKDTAKETEDYYINMAMEKYGTPLDDIVRERTAVNSLYYSSDKEKEFHETMSKGKTITLPEEPTTKNPTNNF